MGKIGPMKSQIGTKLPQIRFFAFIGENYIIYTYFETFIKILSHLTFTVYNLFSRGFKGVQNQFFAYTSEINYFCRKKKKIEQKVLMAKFSTKKVLFFFFAVKYVAPFT